MNKTILLLLICNLMCAQVPQYSVTINSGAPGGYYFTAPFRSNFTGSSLMIIDSTGSLLYSKNYAKGSSFDFKRQPNGKITYFHDQKYYVLDSLLNMVDSVEAQNGYVTDEHELQILPNGNYLILCVEDSVENLMGFNYFHMNGADGSPNATVQCAVIQELTPSKSVVFEWHAKDHFAFSSVSQFWLFDSTKVDWTHSNALHLDNDGNILLSSRHFNEITKINRSNGDIMWRFGGKFNEFLFTGDTTLFYGQHDIRRLPNGHITFYDNGRSTNPHACRGVEYKLDEVNMTAQLVWSYKKYPYFSQALGNVQRLPGTKTLIDYGAINPGNECFNVVDSVGNELFNFKFTNSQYSYRSFNIPANRWLINRPGISCFDSLGISYLRAEANHNAYLWSGQQTARTIPITNASTYYYEVPFGDGGSLRSEKIIVSDPNDLCNLTALTVTGKNMGFKLFPNPAASVLVLRTGTTEEITVTFTDIFGKNISAMIPVRQSDAAEAAFDVSALAPGIYFLNFNGQVCKFVKE